MSPNTDPTLKRIKSALLPVDITDGCDEIKREGQTPAAVLMPLVMRGEWQVILTQRPQTMPTHAGQISFPGGRMNSGEGAKAAALRETHEEIGITSSEIKLLGRLPSFNASYAFRITPYIGIIDPMAEIKADPREVDDVFEVPFDFLMNTDNHIERQASFRDKSFTLIDMPYDDNGTHRNIWGMTAMIMYRLWQRGFAA